MRVFIAIIIFALPSLALAQSREAPAFAPRPGKWFVKRVELAPGEEITTTYTETISLQPNGACCAVTSTAPVVTKRAVITAFAEPALADSWPGGALSVTLASAPTALPGRIILGYTTTCQRQAYQVDGRAAGLGVFQFTVDSCKTTSGAREMRLEVRDPKAGLTEIREAR